MCHKINCTLTEFQKKESMGMPCGGIWRMWGDILIDFLSDTKYGNWHLSSHKNKKLKCVPECYSLCWTIGQLFFLFLLIVLHKEVIDLIQFMYII